MTGLTRITPGGFGGRRNPAFGTGGGSSVVQGQSTIVAEANSVRDRYAMALRDRVTLTRLIGTGSSQTAVAASNIRSRIVQYQPQEIVGTVQQGDQKIIVFYPDLLTAGFPAPPVKGDRITVAGRIMTVQAVDANTRKIGTVLIAYEIQARGQ